MSHWTRPRLRPLACSSVATRFTRPSSSRCTPPGSNCCATRTLRPEQIPDLPYPSAALAESQARVHGTHSHGNWRRQIEASASAGCRAIAPDMRGYGHSCAPADATLYASLHTTGDLVGLLDALKVSSAVLVGHGGFKMRIWELAADHGAMT